MKSLFKSVVLISIFSFLTRLSGFIFRIILSRKIGAEALGLYQIAFSFFIVLLTFISSGIPLIISRMTASLCVKNEKKAESSLVSVGLIYTLCLSLIIGVFIVVFRYLFIKLFPSEICFIILLALLPSLVFSSVYSVLRGSMWGKGNYFALCITEFFEQITRIILALFVISSTFSANKNAINLAWSMSLTCLLSMIFVIVLYFLYGGRLTKPEKKFLRPIIKQSTPITFMRVAGAFIQPLVAMIVPLRLMQIGYTRAQALSLYGIAMGMTIPLLFVASTIIGSLSTALIPEISASLAKKDNILIKKRMQTSIVFTVILSSFFIPLYFGMGQELGIFFFDNIISGTLLQASSWVVLPLGITNITSALLNSVGFEKKSFYNFVIGSILMFISLWFLPSLFGINSIIWSLGINYTVIALLNYNLIRKHIGLDFSLLTMILKLLIIVIPCSALANFSINLMKYILPNFVTLVFGGMVSSCAFLLLVMVFGLIDKDFVVGYIKDKISLIFKRRKASKKV